MAARNVLLNYNLKAKVADFGLAARIYMKNNNDEQIDDEQIGANQDQFPFLNSAYEILRTGVAIKEKSDVWSFGILMWEIFYLGEAFPYADIAGLPELRNYLEKGQRLERPPLCPQSIYDLMLPCWELLYQFRPTFSDLKKDLKKILSNPNPNQQQVMMNSEINSDQEHVHRESSDQTNSYQSHEIAIVSNPAYGLETNDQS